MKGIPILFLPIAGVTITLGAMSACTDVQRSHLGAIGASAHIICYSGGRLVVDDYSTGKVQNASSSDGYEFKSVMTRRLRQVSGDCQIDYGAPRPANWKGL